MPAPHPAIVEREKPKRTKRKGGEMAPKPGKPSWIWGTKLKFFDARKDARVKAHERKTTGEFYLKMAKLYTVKYGFELEDNEDFEVDVEDPPDWVADTVVNVRLSAEEMTKRQEYHTKLREVGSIGAVAQVEAHTETLQKRAEYSGEELPAMITIQNEVTKRRTKYFRRKQGAPWSATRTPEEYNTSLKTAAAYLQPWCDAIAEREVASRCEAYMPGKLGGGSSTARLQTICHSSADRLPLIRGRSAAHAHGRAGSSSTPPKCNYRPRMSSSLSADERRTIHRSSADRISAWLK
ncbi:hypothetical protein B0H13DRAFT_2316091 [Mycena leptocephala]|nr:hypothetical protein B0H13DRAFT_2316091 [Mycena leptocephala]